jgi:hypothetical protein
VLRSKYLFVSASLLAILLGCGGCLAHGDAVFCYKIQGTLIDSNGLPLRNAAVWVSPWAESVNNRESSRAVITTEDGSFRVDAQGGSGNVTWVVCVPLFGGMRQLPPADTLYMVVDHDGRAGRVVLHPPATAQKPVSGGHRTIDLGTVMIAFDDSTERSTPASALAPLENSMEKP